uniref:Uncharacterized protein n=1 Tax=Megaselia scalaris TaxID=36166 RepID=T1GWT6_MEGSC
MDVLNPWIQSLTTLKFTKYSGSLVLNSKCIYANTPDYGRKKDASDKQKEKNIRISTWKRYGL